MGLESAQECIYFTTTISGSNGGRGVVVGFFTLFLSVILDAILTILISYKCLQAHSFSRKRLPKEKVEMNDCTVFQN